MQAHLQLIRAQSGVECEHGRFETRAVTAIDRAAAVRVAAGKPAQPIRFDCGTALATSPMTRRRSRSHAAAAVAVAASLTTTLSLQALARLTRADQLADTPLSRTHSVIANGIAMPQQENTQGRSAPRNRPSAQRRANETLPAQADRGW
ncbi:hypothetical protein [Massilia sp. S19_KUP03_FR1]|uniref:hypothetical protein n=1 Tax=Massilia sp. S19_KUP03_FR1 TaxID=3025503 RepID=UPI002FCD97D4